MTFRLAIISAAVALCSIKTASAAPVKPVPYVGAIAVDAASGNVLVAESPDSEAIPASMVKMMDLLLVQEAIERGEITPQDTVAISKRAAATGREPGASSVWLDIRETFTLEDLLYALMIKSANDAAVAIAEHLAGSCEEMVARMNSRAKELGMKNTTFATVNGLPAKGRPTDISTPRDMALLAGELCRHPDIFKYTSATRYELKNSFRKTPMVLLSHNPLLQDKTPGCDGLKTGYTRAAGFSLAVTVKRDNRRVIVVLMGVNSSKANSAAGTKDSSASEAKTFRDAKTHELLEQAFVALEFM